MTAVTVRESAKGVTKLLELDKVTPNVHFWAGLAVIGKHKGGRQHIMTIQEHKDQLLISED